MSSEEELRTRSESKCELCSATGELCVHTVSATPPDRDANVLVCSTCSAQVEDADPIVVHNWRCLSDSMWSEIPAVQVLTWRMLTRLQAEPWAQDLREMLDLDEAVLAWAQAGVDDTDATGDAGVRHVDSNGTVLVGGDTVTLIKDLDVKGANFTAKRGTSVRNITLVSDNSEHIEGRVSGQHIVILTKFVKKSG